MTAYPMSTMEETLEDLSWWARAMKETNIIPPIDPNYFFSVRYFIKVNTNGRILPKELKRIKNEKKKTIEVDNQQTMRNIRYEITFKYGLQNYWCVHSAKELENNFEPNHQSKKRKSRKKRKRSFKRKTTNRLRHRNRIRKEK